MLGCRHIIDDPILVGVLWKLLELEYLQIQISWDFSLSLSVIPNLQEELLWHFEAQVITCLYFCTNVLTLMLRKRQIKPDINPHFWSPNFPVMSVVKHFEYVTSCTDCVCVFSLVTRTRSSPIRNSVKTADTFLSVFSSPPN